MGDLGRVLIALFIIVLLIVGVWLLVRRLRPEPGIDLPPIRDLIPQPTPTIYPDPVTIVHRVQDLSRLETASYVMEKVITAESGQGPLGFLFGDKLLLVAYGEVIAGVDLGLIDTDDVRVTVDGTLYLRLPDPEVFVATLDNERTYVYDRQTGVVGLNPELETAARQEAESRILEAALEEGLLTRAEGNAEEVLRTMFLGIGFRQIVFVDVLPTPTPIPPTLTPSVTPTVSP